MRPQRILITGANGQLGSELRALYATQGEAYEIISTTRAELPLDEVEQIPSLLAPFTPDIIIHAAAYTAVDKAESEPELAHAVNCAAAGAIANYCKEHNVRLIAISTDYVFDGTSSTPLKEDAETNPINVYGRSKREGELAIQQILQQAIIIRTSWVYSVYGKNFVKTMKALLSTREEISVVDDQIGSPTYAADLAQAIADIISSKHWKGGIYHYCNSGRISWYDFAKEIRRILQAPCTVRPVPSSAYPTPAQRPKFSLLDTQKIEKEFGLHIPDWKESLQKMLHQLTD